MKKLIDIIKTVNELNAVRVPTDFDTLWFDVKLK